MRVAIYNIYFLAFIFLLHISALFSSAVQNERKKGDVDKIFNPYVMDEKVAKAILTVKRGWTKKVSGEAHREHGRERGRESNERARESGERTNEQNNRICPAQCWGPFSESACNAPCGNTGEITLTRSVKSCAALGNCCAWVNSHGCPGSNTMKKPCNRFCHNGGVAQARSCTCKPGFKGTCCEAAVTCPSVGGIANGGFNPNKPNYKYAEVVKYSCNTGFKMIGSPDMKCENSGRLSGLKPTCQQITCPNPGSIGNGKISGTDFRFDHMIIYSCNKGFKLVGPNSRKCQVSGTWSGATPKCELVTCPAPSNPANGKVSLPNGNSFEKTAVYQCNSGFYLKGHNTIICQEDGKWTGSIPTCEAIFCGLLHVISNGVIKYALQVSNKIKYNGYATYSCQSGYVLSGAAKRICQQSGTVGKWSGTAPECTGKNCGNPPSTTHTVQKGTNTVYPTGKVEYQCIPGYYMKGSSKLSCAATGLWDPKPPICTECPKDTYLEGISTNTKCLSCPAHSHTSNAASNNKKLCVCEKEYNGPNGGPCKIKTCPAPGIPVNALSKKAFKSIVGEVCWMECMDGYITVSGDNKRTCEISQKWSGKEIKCEACTVNKYKKAENVCEFCPEDSHTVGPAQMKKGCKCDRGFTGPEGGPCKDINECAIANGRCEQTCVNTPGSYECKCTKPGFIEDAADKRKCAALNKCPKIAPPANGGYVCVMLKQIVTQKCGVKCNKGYDFNFEDNSPNAYETCGPETDWKWTTNHRDHEYICAEAYFEGCELEAEVFYWADDCNKLTSEDKNNAIKDFMKFLTNSQVCSIAGPAQCNLEDFSISCGSSTYGSNTKVIVHFKVILDAVPTLSIDCRQICDRKDVSDRYCDNRCHENYLKSIQASVKVNVKNVIEKSSDAESTIKVANVVLIPSKTWTIKVM